MTLSKNKKLPALVDTTFEIIDTTALTIIVVIAIVGVLSRLLFNKPIFWSMELSTSLAVWMTFIIAGYNHKHDIHFKVDLFYEMVSASGKKFFDYVSMIITAGCVAVCLYSAIVAFIRNSKISMAALEISVSYSLYLPLIIGYAAYLIYILIDILVMMKKPKQENV